MTNQNTAAQSTKTTKKSVDFSHRFSGTHENDTYDEIDTIGLMTSRALGVLHSLAVQFDGGGSRMSDVLISGALDSIICEVEDIESTIIAFSKSQSANNGGGA